MEEDKYMKLAIMQPYFFPYLGYFSLIKNTDHFVFFDTPQYIRKGWINRNRIIGGGEKTVYITVPVTKSSRETAIKDIHINYNENWRNKIRGQLSIYKRRAPFYKDVMDIVEEVIMSENISIAKMAMKSVIQVCEYLDIDFSYDVFSEMQYAQIKANESDEWALNITKAMGYDTYVNPPGGKSFFHKSKYEKEGIQLQFLTQKLEPYNQKTPGFIEGLSIIDLMMFCKPEEISRMMDNYVIE